MTTRVSVDRSQSQTNLLSRGRSYTEKEHAARPSCPRREFQTALERGFMRLAANPSQQERLASLAEIYVTALGELRAWRLPQSAGLIASLEALLARTKAEQRYLSSRANTNSRPLV